MITPMKKYAFLVFHKEYQEFLTVAWRTWSRTYR